MTFERSFSLPRFIRGGFVGYYMVLYGIGTGISTLFSARFYIHDVYLGIYIQSRGSIIHVTLMLHLAM